MLKLFLVLRIEWSAFLHSTLTPRHVFPGIGPYVEVAFFHKQSKTLLVTDAVIYVPERPPEVVGKDALLEAAKNGLAVKILSAGREVPDDPIVDNEATRQKGTNSFDVMFLLAMSSNG